MNSRARPSFWRAYARLSEANRKAARRAYALFGKNPAHPALRFKKLAGYEHVWSVRINEQYRAVGERHGDTLIWVWVGTHNEFDSLFG
jgi:Txe/YoeB family toxin of Txe-Axe toxin-antitoxin module